MNFKRLILAASLGLGLTLLLLGLLRVPPDMAVAHGSASAIHMTTSGNNLSNPSSSTDSYPVTQVITTFSILVDDFIPQPYQDDKVYYYNRLDGDYGATGIETDSVLLDRGYGQLTATIKSGSWGGVWMSLNHPVRENQPVNFSAVLPAQVLPSYQSQITGLAVQVARGTPGRTFRLELKDGSDRPWWSEFTLSGGQQALNYQLPLTLTNISQLVWVLDQSMAEDYVVVERVAFTATTPITDIAQAGFVWSYGMLLNNWNPATGLVRDKAKDASGEFDAIQATGSLAAATAVAKQLGVISYTAAVQIVTQISNTLLSAVPRYHGLWPHWVWRSPTGTLAILTGTEWSSVDTVIAAIGLLEAQSALSLTTSGTEQMLREIDWVALGTPNGISHGYDYTGTRLSSSWDTFGGESWLVQLAYTAANHRIAPLKYCTPPTANGSGFIDELAWLFVPPPQKDCWGTGWPSYRQSAVDTQTLYYPTHYPTHCYSQLGWFGLSAAEVPVPSAVTKTQIYQPSGVGGRFAAANDGSALLGVPVVVPHYSTLIASLRPTEAISMWAWLINAGPLSPLNNVESLAFPQSSSCNLTEMQWNQLKGSWNLALQALGWGRYLAERQGQASVLWQAVTSTTFLSEGYRLLASAPITPRCPSGIITAVGRHLDRDGVPFEAHGMNYYPKDYAWSRLWFSYTEALTQTNEELDRAKSLGVNTVRIFLPYDLFDGGSQSSPYLGYLADFVGRLQARDMVAIVTLFDLYTGVTNTHPYSMTDYITNTRHISTVINALGPTNPAILAWDIKNELDRDYDIFGKAQVKAWATEMISYTRRLDPDHLITIGFYGAVTGTLCYDPAITNTLVYSPAIAAEFAPSVDFVSMHYFLSERCFESDLSALQSQIGDKPIVLEEFGLHTLANPSIPCKTNPGDPHCDDPHTETEQAAYYNALLSLGEAYGVAGYDFWTLADFSYILTDSQQSHHCQGILRNSLVDVCQVTTTLDYTGKPAAETIRRHYADYIAYLDLFDGWVDPNTQEPPAGWTDNWQAGGAYLRGYKPSDPLWSQDPGKVAFSKWGSTGATGVALSPALKDMNVDRYPILAGQVYSYSIRDSGHDSILYVGVKEGTQITRLLTVFPTTTLPYTFAVDLHQPPLNWSGTRTFSIALELVPQTGDGYSASYEFDWIALESAVGADFIASPITGVAPLTIVFTNTSTGDYATSLWNFGDTVTSTLNSPTHTYTTAGAYTVTLTVSGTGGTDTLTHTNYITAYTPVHANYSASPTSGVAPLPVVFTNTSTGDYAASLWGFGDSVTSTLPSPTHTYTTKGTYGVTLTVSGPGGVDTLTYTNYITVYAPVQAGFMASPISGTPPLTVTFANTSTGDYAACLWNFGDTITSTEFSPTHIYTTAGVYTVTLTMSGPGGSDEEIKASYITAYQPVHAAFVASPTSGLRPLTVVFTNTSTGDYTTSLWNFGDSLTSTLNSPTHTYTAKGIYTVTLAVNGSGGTDMVTRTSYIAVYAPVHAGFVASPITGVAPITVTFTNTSTGDYTASLWSFGDGITSALKNPTYTYASPGTYTVTLTVSGLGGTDALTRTNYITVYAPVHVGFAASPITGVAPITVTFTNTSTGDYTTSLWSFGDGITSTQKNPTYTYASPGTYTVTLMVSGPGGTDALSRTNYITAYAPVHVGFVASPITGVAPITVTFTNTSIGDYAASLWDFGDGVISTTTSPTHIYMAKGTYTVTLTVSGLGGTDTLTRANYITAYEPVKADFKASPVCGGVPLTVTFTNLSSGDYFTSSWNFGDNMTSILPNPTYTYTLSGTYTVTLTVNGPGGTDRKIRDALITCPCRVYLPIILRN